MKPLFKTILAIILGGFGGSLINMLFVQTGHAIFPIEGLDPNDLKALAALIPTLDFKYFIFPLLAHAIGTLSGAFIAARIATPKKMKAALVVGVLFLISGIIANFMIQGPVWFAVTDILLAYIPMAWLGGKIGIYLSKERSN